MSLKKVILVGILTSIFFALLGNLMYFEIFAIHFGYFYFDLGWYFLLSIIILIVGVYLKKTTYGLVYGTICSVLLTVISLIIDLYFISSWGLDISWVSFALVVAVEFLIFRLIFFSVFGALGGFIGSKIEKKGLPLSVSAEKVSRICPNCGRVLTELPPDIRKCPYCGRDLATKEGQ